MEELSQKISDFLGNPENMNMLSGLMGALSSESAPAESEAGAVHVPQTDASFSPEMMNMAMKFAPVMQGLGKENKNTQLLRALRPMLAQEKQKRVDNAILFMQLVKVFPAIDLKSLL